jgi:hypothetical protein
MKSHLEIAGLICAVCLFVGVLRWSVNESTVFGDNAEDSDVSSEGYVRGEPVYDMLPADDPDVVCCYPYRAGFCSRLDYGGRRPCDFTPLGDSGDDDYMNPYGHELRVVDGCPTYVLVGNEFCVEGENPEQ